MNASQLGLHLTWMVQIHSQVIGAVAVLRGRLKGIRGDGTSTVEELALKRKGKSEHSPQ